MVVAGIMVVGTIATSVVETDMVRIMDYGKDDDDDGDDGGTVKW